MFDFFPIELKRMFTNEPSYIHYFLKDFQEDGVTKMVMSITRLFKKRNDCLFKLGFFEALKYSNWSYKGKKLKSLKNSVEDFVQSYKLNITV